MTPSEGERWQGRGDTLPDRMMGSTSSYSRRTQRKSRARSCGHKGAALKPSASSLSPPGSHRIPAQGTDTSSSLLKAGDVVWGLFARKLSLLLPGCCPLRLQLSRAKQEQLQSPAPPAASPLSLQLSLQALPQMAFKGTPALAWQEQTVIPVDTAMLTVRTMIPLKGTPPSRPSSWEDAPACCQGRANLIPSPQLVHRAGRAVWDLS